MADEETYINLEASMQAAAFKGKHGEATANMKGVDDPAYENITLTFRKQDQPKGSHSPPKSEVPARSRPSLDSAQAHHWVHTAIKSLHILLALFSIILLVWVLVKNFERSQELQVLKMELQNVSMSVLEGHEEQKQGWSDISRKVIAARQHVDVVKTSIQTGKEQLLAELNLLKTELQKISQKLQKMSDQQSAPQ